MIGDSACDIEAAINCKMDNILVLTGNGNKTKKTLNKKPMYISKNLLSASNFLINR